MSKFNSSEFKTRLRSVEDYNNSEKFKQFVFANTVGTDLDAVFVSRNSKLLGLEYKYVEAPPYQKNITLDLSDSQGRFLKTIASRFDYFYIVAYVPDQSYCYIANANLIEESFTGRIKIKCNKISLDCLFNNIEYFKRTGVFNISH